MNIKYLYLLSMAALIIMCGCGRKPEKPKNYAKALAVSVTLGSKAIEEGITRVDYEDGRSYAATMDGKECRRLDKLKWNYLYFLVAPSFKTSNPMDVNLDVEYYDVKPGTFGIHYDTGGEKGPYTGAPKKVRLTGAECWKTATFTLSNARFENRQNGHADFRLNTDCSEFYVRSVKITRK